LCLSAMRRLRSHPHTPKKPAADFASCGPIRFHLYSRSKLSLSVRRKINFLHFVRVPTRQTRPDDTSGVNAKGTNAWSIRQAGERERSRPKLRDACYDRVVKPTPSIVAEFASPHIGVFAGINQ
jgi:hypothetical protein